jgi:hypothetical protein
MTKCLRSYDLSLCLHQPDDTTVIIIIIISSGSITNPRDIYRRYGYQVPQCAIYVSRCGIASEIF